MTDTSEYRSYLQSIYEVAMIKLQPDKQIKNKIFIDFKGYIYIHI